MRPVSSVGITTGYNATCQGDTDDSENVCADWTGEGEVHFSADNLSAQRGKYTSVLTTYLPKVLSSKTSQPTPRQEQTDHMTTTRAVSWRKTEPLRRM